MFPISQDKEENNLNTKCNFIHFFQRSTVEMNTPEIISSKHALAKFYLNLAIQIILLRKQNRPFFTIFA